MPCPNCDDFLESFEMVNGFGAVVRVVRKCETCGYTEEA
jgi:C4-type Zn-finger protein